MLKRLRLKFILVNMTIVTVMLCIIFGVVLQTTHRNIEEESIRMMQMMAGEHIRPGRPGDKQEEIRLPFFTLDVRTDGEVIASDGGYYDLSDEEFLEHLTDIVLLSEERVGVVKEYNLRFLRVQTRLGERMVFADVSSERSMIEGLISSSLLIGTISFAVFLLISILLARWAVKPVEKAWEQQRQFVADASHELKTPLTVIITNAELLQNSKSGEASRRQFSDSILSMARQMRVLTESLLNLARVDNGSVKTTFAPVDFSRIVNEAILPFEPVYFERGRSLATQIDDGIILKGSEIHLHQVVEILLDNAQKYSSEHGEIAIALKKQGHHCLLSVTNPGETISKENLKNIFKRFYRIDQARTHDGSYGLGLSIAYAIVMEHRGKIWAESEAGMNSFFVQIPVS